MRKRLGYLVQHRALGPDIHPQITAQHIAEKPPHLHQNRLIQAHPFRQHRL